MERTSSIVKNLNIVGNKNSFDRGMILTKENLTGYASIDKPWLKYYDEKDIESSFEEQCSMYDYILSKNQDKKRYIAINYYGSIYTYEYMFKKINEYASRFTAMGIKKDDIVSICMPTIPETIYSIYALNKLGVVCDMIDPRSNKDQMGYYLSENNSKVLLLCDNYYTNMKESLDKSNLDKTVLIGVTPSAPLKLKLLLETKSRINNLNRKLSDNVMLWKDFEKLDSTIETISQKNSEDTALIVHSSGTTSVPKGIKLSNKNVNSIAFQYSKTSLSKLAHDIYPTGLQLYSFIVSKKRCLENTPTATLGNSISGF